MLDVFHIFMHPVQKIIFRRDVVIELPHRHTGNFDDIADGRRMVSFPEKYFARTIHYLSMLLLNQINVLSCGTNRMFKGLGS
jgi:hypothetical protein